MRTFYHLVTPADVNAWLEKQGAQYRWNVAAPVVTPEHQAAPAKTGTVEAPASARVRRHTVTYPQGDGFIGALALVRKIADAAAPLPSPNYTLVNVQKRVTAGKNHTESSLSPMERAQIELIWVQAGLNMNPEGTGTSKAEWQRYLDAFASAKEKMTGSAPSWVPCGEFADLDLKEAEHLRQSILSNQLKLIDAALKAGTLEGIHADHTPANGLQPELGSIVSLNIESARVHFKRLGIDLEPDADTQAEVIEVNVRGAIASAQWHREHRTPAPLQIGHSDTRLTKWLQRETWTPDEAALLVYGLDPDSEHRTLNGNRAMKGLCGNHFSGDAAFHRAEKLAKDWRRRVDAPEKVVPAKFVAWCKTVGINTDWLRDVPSAPTPEDTDTQAAQVVEAPADEPSKRHLAAEPAELIAAFGAFTGMDKSWFSKLDDKPELQRAKFRDGESGRNGCAPLFFVFPVMQWLINAKRKTGKPMQEATGWRVVKNQFPRVYKTYQESDPTAD